MSAITAKASRKMKKYAVLTREPRCFLGSFDFSWEQRKVGEVSESYSGGTPSVGVKEYYGGQIPFIRSAEINSEITELFLTEEGLKNSSARLVAVGDILYALYGATSGEVGRARLKGAINQAILAIKPHTDYDSEYLAQWLRKSKHSIIETYLQGGQGNLSGTIVKELSVDFPSLKEQKAIGDFFRQLDNLITLHQRKCANLCSPSQVVFSLLFATSTFSWEQRKLGDIASDMVAGGDIDKDLILAEGQYPVIANALTGDGIVGYYDKEYRVNAPAVTVTGRGDVGHAKARLVNFTPVVRLLSVKSEHDVFFLENAINTLKIVIESTGVPQLTVPQLAKYEVAFPRQLDEEEHIGAFFKQLDHLITLHQRECISFTGRADRLILTANKKRTTSSWEQRKFEEIAVRSSVICSDDTLPRVEYEDIVSGTGRLNKDIYAKQSIKSGIAFHQGDVLYGKLRPYLQNWLLPTFDGLAVGDFWVLQPQNADSSFLYRLIQSRQFDEVANQSTGTKMPRADWKLVSKTVFSIPSNISEQAAIGTYFTALDSLITLHQRKFEKLTNVKKSMLEKMFPQNGSSYPEIRFKGFTDPWEQRKLGDVVQITMGQSPDGSTYSDEPSDYILVQGNADLQNGWVCPRIWTTQITKKADAGDLIMSVRAPAGAMGKTAYNAVIGRGVAAIKGNEFIYQLLVKMDADGFWKTLSCGSTFESLNSDNIKNAEVKIPTTAEQIKIGGYFQQLDNLITLHQRELEKLQNIKKSMLEKMFV